MAVTNERGSYHLENLPAGEHELVVWHEAVGYVAKRLKITVVAGQDTELDSQEISVARLRSAKK